MYECVVSAAVTGEKKGRVNSVEGEGEGECEDEDEVEGVQQSSCPA